MEDRPNSSIRECQDVIHSGLYSSTAVWSSTHRGVQFWLVWHGREFWSPCLTRVISYPCRPNLKLVPRCGCLISNGTDIRTRIGALNFNSGGNGLSDSLRPYTSRQEFSKSGKLSWKPMGVSFNPLTPKRPTANLHPNSNKLTTTIKIL